MQRLWVVSNVGRGGCGPEYNNEYISEVIVAGYGGREKIMNQKNSTIGFPEINMPEGGLMSLIKFLISLEIYRRFVHSSLT